MSSLSEAKVFTLAQYNSPNIKGIERYELQTHV
jgi:hypothetical protein